MELLAGVGLAAKGLFDYNRENFKFDQDQRLERELLRVEMRVKRFELFREDARDLMALTVDRMDVYHVAGALFLEFCVVLFAEGRIEAEDRTGPPPFLLALFLLSNACAFVYILLGVWLSMHASIAAHSFGVRLLTRFLRLPIPSSKQLSSLTSKLAEFEFQDVGNLMRMPFQGKKQKWVKKSSDEKEESAATAAEGAAMGSGHTTLMVTPGDAASGRERGGGAISSLGARSSAHSAGAGADNPDVASAATGEAQDVPNANGHHDELTTESPFLNEEFLLQPALAPGRHVMLFRRIQAKWQCYDAYCRVCMTLGVNQILQGLSYYAILHMMIEHRSSSGALAVLIFFQAAALSLSLLDITGLHRWAICLIQLIGTVPAFLAWVSIALKLADLKNSEEPLPKHGKHYLTPVIFFMEACWLNLLLWLAQPSNDEACLPRRFRPVLFLDVFGDAIDPTEVEMQPERAQSFHTSAASSAGPDSSEGAYLEQVLLAERIVAAEEALSTSRVALARWAKVPSSTLSSDQSEELKRLHHQVQLWEGALRTELAWRAARRGLPHAASAWNDVEDMHPWGEIPLTMQDEDPFAGLLLGPFEHDTGYQTSTYYYNAERCECVWSAPRGRILLLPMVAASVRSLEAAVRLLLAMEETSGMEEETADESLTAWPGDAVVIPIMSTPSLGKKLQNGYRNLKQYLRRRAILDYAEGLELSDSRGLDRPLLSMDRRDSWCTETAAATPQAPLAQPEAPPQQDQTSRYFVPARLPWVVLKNITRLLQLAWLLGAIMQLYRLTQQTPPTKGKHEQSCALKDGSTCQDPLLVDSPLDYNISGPSARLLGESEDVWLEMEELEVVWSEYLAFVRIHRASCYSTSAHDAVLGTSLGSYLVKVVAPAKLTLELAPEMSSDAVLICPPSSASRGGCLMARLLGSSVQVAPWWINQSKWEAKWTTVRLAGSPWRLLAGAIVPALSIPDLRPRFSAAQDSEDWCLMLAGWDGRGGIPLAVLPLQLGAAGMWSLSSKATQLHIDIRGFLHHTRQGAGQVRRGQQSMPHEEIASLHFSLDGSQLNAILHQTQERGWEALHWDMAQMQPAGRTLLWWPDHWDAACEVSVDTSCQLGNRLVVAGHQRQPGALAGAPFLVASRPRSWRRGESVT